MICTFIIEPRHRWTQVHKIIQSAVEQFWSFNTFTITAQIFKTDGKKSSLKPLSETMAKQLYYFRCALKGLATVNSSHTWCLLRVRDTFSVTQRKIFFFSVFSFFFFLRGEMLHRDSATGKYIQHFQKAKKLKAENCWCANDHTWQIKQQYVLQRNKQIQSLMCSVVVILHAAKQPPIVS